AVPRMAVLVATGLDTALPVVPVGAELPVRATGAAVAVEVAAPVLPVLVALFWDQTSPVAPLVAVGLPKVTVAVPPAPPRASAVATEEPPRAVGPVVALAEPAPRIRLRAAPPLPAAGRATPPAPPRRLRAPKTLAMPRMPVLRAKGLEVGVPGVPGVPELPVWATGLEVDTEVAAPVAPVLVAEDCTVASPLVPEVAAGVTARLAL